MFKLIILGIAAYMAYTFFIKPRTLPERGYREEDHDDEYVDYEEIKD